MLWMQDSRNESSSVSSAPEGSVKSVSCFAFAESRKPTAGFLLPISYSGNSLANLGRQLIVDSLCAHSCHVLNYDRRGGGEGNDEPHQAGKGEACKRDKFKQVGVIRVEVANGSESNEEQHGRDAGHDDETNV